MKRDSALPSIFGFANSDKRRIDRRAGVDDEYVAAFEERWKTEEACVGDVIIARVRHHEPHFIAREATRFRRLMRRKRIGKDEVDSCLQGCHATSRIDGRRSPAE